MPTFVTLTKLCADGKGELVCVNLDLVKLLRRLPEIEPKDYRPGMPERTLLTFADHGGPDYGVLAVAETPVEIVDKGRMEVGWPR